MDSPSMSLDPFTMKFSSPSEFGMLLAAAGRVRPAFYDEMRKIWVILRHRDVVSALHDQERFTATFYKVGPLGGSFLAEDGPLHLRGRRVFTRAFAPLGIRRAEDFIRPSVERILSRLEQKDGAELIGEFCLELPMQVIGALLGVGYDFIQDYRSWVPKLIRWIVFWADPAIVAEGRAAHRQMLDRMRPYVEAQIDKPGDNLVGALVQAQREEGEVDVEMVLQLSVGLILGGYETTAGMLAATLTSLLLHPEAMARVRADRGLLMQAVDEAGRWVNPSLGVLRGLLCDVDLGDGVVLEKGSAAMLCSAAAHYDDSVFPRPEVFDLDRQPDSLIFGGGPHFCMGAPLARMEAKIGLSALLDRLQDLRIDPEKPLTYACGMRGTVLHGPEDLYVRYTGQSQRKAA